jgi:maltooligosyltrehalose trehalohydrolase
VRGKHKILFDFYRALIYLRQNMPALKNLLKEKMEVEKLGGKALFVRRWFAADDVSCVFSFNEKHGDIALKIPRGVWVKVLDSSSEEWGGEGEAAHKVIESSGNEVTVPMPPYGFVVYKMQGPAGPH